MTNSPEREIAERFLEHADEDSFAALFRLFSPQLVAFFRKRGHEMATAEDLAQDVMWTVYRSAAQLRDRRLFRAWLFKVARHAACRHFARKARQVPTVDVSGLGEVPAIVDRGCLDGPAFEFGDWMSFLEPHERETMTLRFVEDWEYHEIAAAQAVPMGTVQWRVFNSKRKLAALLTARSDTSRKAA